MKYVAVILVLLGMVLLGVGMSMREKKNVFTKTEDGSKIESMAFGATAGAVAGGAGAVGVGGIGIVLCGTGFGIPAGAVCLLGAGVCALIGGGIGYAVGTPDKTVTIVEQAYSAWEYWSVIVIGCLLISIGMFYLLRTLRRPDVNCKEKQIV